MSDRLMITRISQPVVAMDPLPGDLFARRLSRERERSGVDTEDLALRVAHRLGWGVVDPTLILRIEDQTHVLRLDEAVVLAEALEVPLLDMISDEADEEIGDWLSSDRGQIGESSS